MAGRMASCPLQCTRGRCQEPAPYGGPWPSGAGVGRHWAPGGPLTPSRWHKRAQRRLARQRTRETGPRELGPPPTPPRCRVLTPKPQLAGLLQPAKSPPRRSTEGPRLPWPPLRRARMVWSSAARTQPRQSPLPRRRLTHAQPGAPTQAPPHCPPAGLSFGGLQPSTGHLSLAPRPRPI